MESKIEQVLIKGIYYPLDSTQIVKDYYTKEYILKNEAHELGSQLSMSKMEGFRSFIVSYFSISIQDVLVNTMGLNCSDGVQRRILKDAEILRGNGTYWIDPLNRNIAYDDVEWNKIQAKKNKNKFRAFNNQVKKFKDYDSEYLTDEERKQILERDIVYGVRSNTFKAFEGLDYTFGVELETSSGNISELECDGLNLKCEFDGSLRDTPDQRREDVLGGEYITGVLTGDAGIYQLQRTCRVLAEKCTINKNAGIHVHVGGLKFNKLNIVYMYLLGVLLQDEIFSLLPISRRNNSYCRKLKTLRIDQKQLNNAKTPLMYKLLIDEYYNQIHVLVSSGKLPDKKTNKSTNHPMGSKCGYDKNAQRYCWLNFVTCMFNTKGSTDAYTLEFRNHHSSLNFIKIKHWVKLCMAFCAFAENHQDSIRRGFWLDQDGNQHPINLQTIIKVIYPKRGKLLSEYVERRKNLFAHDIGDIEALEYERDLESIKKLTLTESICA